MNTVPSVVHEAAHVLDQVDQEVSPKLELVEVVDPVVPVDLQSRGRDLVQ